MDLRHLRTFVTVAEQGSVSKAAVLLRIAQPALSRQIADLEHELGLQLFDRLGRRLALTSDGEQLLGHCRSSLNSVNLIAEQARLLRGGEGGLLKVAAPPVQIESVLATFLPRFARLYPQVQVRVVESAGLNSLAMIERGEIQLSISVLSDIRPGRRPLAFCPVPSIELVAASPQSRKFARGSTIDLVRLASFPLLLLDSGYSSRRMLDAVCRLSQLDIQVLTESRTPHALLALAEAGLGIAIVPGTMKTHRYRVRVSRIIHKGKPLSIPLAIVWDSRRELPAYAKNFCNLLAAHMSELSPSASSRRRRAR